jgi:hypothetical protein
MAAACLIQVANSFRESLPRLLQFRFARTMALLRCEACISVTRSRIYDDRYAASFITEL